MVFSFLPEMMIDFNAGGGGVSYVGVRQLMYLAASD